MAGAWLFPCKIDAFPQVFKKMKNCAVVMEAILLNFLKVRGEISVSVHILRIFYRATKISFFFFFKEFFK